jgi:acyl-CoA synthetase (AMP-forming)/AMP-acid ligase II
MNQLCYSGPNVMMGYAQVPADLASGDLLQGTLRSGDLAECDSEGFFFLKGRLSRYAKLFGKRISLASLEDTIETAFSLPTIAIEGHDKISLYLENAKDTEAVRLHVAKFLGVPPLSIAALAIEKLPRTLSGKKNYNHFRQK